MIALDTETVLISDEHPCPPLVVASLGWSAAEATLVHQSDPDLPDLLRDVLQETIALANAPFDLAVISEHCPELEPLVWRALAEDRIVDVLTRERLLDLSTGRGLKRPYGLDSVAARRCGIELDKANKWRKRYGELLHVPVSAWPADAQSYALDDATSTWATAHAQLGAADAYQAQEGMYPLADAGRQARGHWALHLSSLWGVCTDPVAVEAQNQKLTCYLAERAEALKALGLVRSNGQRDMAAVQALAAQSGLTAKTPTGRLKTDEETLAALDLPDDHPLALLRDYGSIMSTRTRLYRAFDRPVIRTHYVELVENGRVSSSAPNLQNLPRGAKNKPWQQGWRECLVPREGCLFVGADYNKMELATWAEILIRFFGWQNHRADCAGGSCACPPAPTSALARALIAGTDPHAELGAELGLGDPKVARQTAKPANFGFPGLMGVERFQAYARKYGVLLDHDGIRKLRQHWARKWSPWAYFDYVKETCEDGIVQLGSNRIRAGLSLPEACNSLFSGLAADIAKDCSWRLACEMYIPPDQDWCPQPWRNGNADLYGARQVLETHDEFVLECEADRADQVGARLAQVMADTFSDWCEHVPCGASVSVMERYRKD